MADDLTRHLATLNSLVITENMISWEQVIAQIETMLAKKSSKYWTAAKLDFIRALAQTTEARLFRVGLSKIYLTISTSPKLGLERGEPYLRLIWNEKNIPALEYCHFGKTSFQAFSLTSFDDPLFQLLPFLKRLWYEGQKTPKETE
jgi:hypothetical protein